MKYIRNWSKTPVYICDFCNRYMAMLEGHSAYFNVYLDNTFTDLSITNSSLWFCCDSCNLEYEELYESKIQS